MKLENTTYEIRLRTELLKAVAQRDMLAEALREIEAVPLYIPRANTAPCVVQRLSNVARTARNALARLTDQKGE